MPFWNLLAVYTQGTVIKEVKAEALDPVDERFGQADDDSLPDAASVTPQDSKITYGEHGVISIPAVAYNQSAVPKGFTVLKSIPSGFQVNLNGFSSKGDRPLRGGSYESQKPGPGGRLRSSGYGYYEDWGFRAAMTATGDEAPRELTLELGDGVKMEFVYIKPGSFMMGGDSTSETKYVGATAPQHKVTISKGFYLGKYEVTRTQFQAVMGTLTGKSQDALDLPIVRMSEHDALWFCDAAAEKTGREVRLPSEAEWEYACRAGTETQWFFGDDESKLGEYAWIKSNSDKTLQPVGQKKPNPWGLYDMLGNVFERVGDVYNKTYYANSPEVDPTGPAQEIRSFEYTITAPKLGKYELTARVATASFHQHLKVAVNGTESDATLRFPFTLGKWQDSKPVTCTLKHGANTLRFSRTPPQRGMAIKSFTLKPVQ